MDVVVHSFSVTPDEVEMGGAATVHWSVTLPDIEDIELRLNGQYIGAWGQRLFTNLTQTTDFLLSTISGGEENLLLRRTVIVNPPECRWSTPIDPWLLIQLLKVQFDDRFSGSSQFSLRGDGTEVTIGDGTINIAVPIKIVVDNWFDADMDIAIAMSVQGGGGSKVIVLSRGISLNVSWSFFESLASLGCTNLVENGMSKLGTVLMSNIVETELVPQIAKAFNERVDSFIAQAQAEDPQHRTFVLAYFELTPNGVRFKVCPT